ncbi:MAG: hypothetical protein ABI222_03410 [Opitutaceae bacterium]
MLHYLKVGQPPRKHHVKFPREAAASCQVGRLRYALSLTTASMAQACLVLSHPLS